MLTYSRTIRIEFGDCDPAGIVYFPRYLVWFDNNTVGLFELAGVPLRERLMSLEIIGIPMVDVRAKFFLPLLSATRSPSKQPFVNFAGAASTFIIAYSIGARWRPKGSETRVWAGRHPELPERLKSRPIPKDLIARFQ